MIRLGKFIAVVLVLILGFAMTYRMFETMSEDKVSVPPRLGGSQTISDGVQASERRRTHAEEHQRSRLVQHLKQEVDAGHSGKARAEGHGQTAVSDRVKVSDAARAPETIDDSVVGQPFPVSESVVRECQPVPGKFRWTACDPTKNLLAEMAKEPREEPWATSAEARIRSFVEQEPGKFTIRALECRTSICFVEAASIYDSVSFYVYEFEKNSGLKAEYPVHADETDESGAKIDVTLWPLTRK